MVSWNTKPVFTMSMEYLLPPASAQANHLHTYQKGQQHYHCMYNTIQLINQLFVNIRAGWSTFEPESPEH